MTQTTDTFDWSVHEFVMGYAVETSEQHAIPLGGHTLKIDRDTFATELYVRRGDFEDEFLRSVTGGGAPLYLVGERGQGKSSALYWIQHEIRTIPDFETMVVVNVQKLLDKVVDPNLSASQAGNEFSRLLRLHLLDELFEPHRSRFLAWALAGPPDSDEDFDRALLTEFGDLAAGARSEAQVVESDSRAKRRSTLEAYFRSVAGKKLFRTIDEKAQQLVRPAHVLQAALSVKPLPYLIVAYDNIDQLHGPWQRQILELVEATHAALSGACGTVVCIRRENVAGLMSGPGGGAYAIRVVLSGGRPYPGMQFPEDHEDHIKRVLEVRHGYAKRLLNEQTEMSVHDHLAHADKHHGNIVNEMVSAHIQKLANFNMRTIVRMYVEFGRYIRRHVPMRAIDPPHLATLLFLWLFEEGETFGIELHDVFRVGPAVRSFNDVPPAASAHHLLMTGLLNLMAEQERAKAEPPRFSEVMRRMRLLGFRLEHIKDALKSLSSNPGVPPKIVALLGEEQHTEGLTEESSVRLRLTVCGIELVSHVFNRIGYVWGRAYKHHTGSEAGRGYLELPRDKRIEILVEYMLLMTRQHLFLLESIRTLWMQEAGIGWLKRYRQWFGVDELLQVERILDSAIKFFGHHFGDEGPFYRLKEAYSAILGELSQGGDSWKNRLGELDTAVKGQEA